jgi:hypothetical protein
LYDLRPNEVIRLAEKHSKNEAFHSPLRFDKWALHYFPHYFTRGMSPFHEWIADLLSEFHLQRGRRQNVKAPRGNAKTVWSTNTYPLYVALEGLEPFIMIGADAGQQSRAYLASLTYEVENNDQIRKDYGPVATNAHCTLDRIVLGNDCCIEHCSTGGPILGRKWREYRPSLFVLDDLQKRKNIHSPLHRQRSMEWVTKDAIKAGDPNTNVLVLGTALHREAIVCQLDKQPGWESKTWKSMIQWPSRMDLWNQWSDIWRNWDDPNRQEAAKKFFDDHPEMNDGQVLWPQNESLYTLMLLRLSEGEAAFESEKQNNPYDPAMAAWPPEYFNWPGIWWQKLPEDITGSVVSLDPSLGRDSQTGDRWAITTMAQNTGGVLFTDTIAGRGGGVDDMLTKTCIACRDTNAEALTIETMCFQELLKEPLKRIAAQLDIRLPRIIEDRDVTNKEVRIHRLGPSLSQRKMRFRRNSPGIAIFLSEGADFANGATDDCLDSAEKAHRFFVKPKNFDLH